MEGNMTYLFTYYKSIHCNSIRSLPPAFQNDPKEKAILLQARSPGDTF